VRCAVAELHACAAARKEAAEHWSRVAACEQSKLQLVLQQLHTLRRLQTHRKQQQELHGTAQEILAAAEAAQQSVKALEGDVEQLEEERRALQAKVPRCCAPVRCTPVCGAPQVPHHT
jgi:division protein CdvB (Snf7/Vps24/ESCRT-III family)